MVILIRRLYDHVKKLGAHGQHDQDLLVDYTREEWDTTDGFRSLARYDFLMPQ